MVVVRARNEKQTDVCVEFIYVGCTLWIKYFRLLAHVQRSVLHRLGDVLMLLLLLFAANGLNIDDEFFDMIAGIQGSRMDDQRASIPPFPGLHHSRTVIGQFAAATRQQEDSALDDQFFEMLMRCQVGHAVAAAAVNDVMPRVGSNCICNAPVIVARNYPQLFRLISLRL